MAFKDKDDFLDQYYDHIFGDNEPDDDDNDFFEHLAKFFDRDEFGDGNSNSPRRRRNTSTQNQNTTTTPRRKRRQNAPNSGGSYGSSAWFGTGS